MNIVEKGYKIFQNYQVSTIENACTFCCLDEEEVNQLVNLPLREIPVALLSTYNDSAQATEPEIREFKHFLPRYLDLVYQFEFPSHSVELSLRNISNYNQDCWEQEEWEFLNEFVIAFFKKCLITYPIPNSFNELSAILIMLNKAGFSLPPFLELWENEQGINGCLHYKEMMTSDFNWMKKTKIGNPFANEDQSNLLYNWSVKKTILNKYAKQIEEIILGNTKLEEDDLNELNWLYDFLKIEIG